VLLDSKNTDSRWNFVAKSHIIVIYIIPYLLSGYRPLSLISHSPRHTAVFRSVQSCCLTAKTQVKPLEFRCYLAIKLRYVLFYISFRLQAAIFHILLTLTQLSVQTSPTVFLDLKNGCFPWKFADISFVSWDPSYMTTRTQYEERNQNARVLYSKYINLFE